MAKQFYGEDKVKPARVAYLVMLPNKQNIAKNNNEGIIPQLAEGTYQNSDKPSLKQMLALSQNNHNRHLSKYETIDQKLHNNPKAFKASHRKRLYRA